MTFGGLLANQVREGEACSVYLQVTLNWKGCKAHWIPDGLDKFEPFNSRCKFLKNKCMLVHKYR